MLGTLSEEDIPRRAGQGHALSVVLCYDDLLAKRESFFALDEGAPLLIGRAPEGVAEARLRGGVLHVCDGWASSRHALLEFGPQGCRLVDQDSRNGCYVNGERTSACMLTDGDLIEIGHTLLCFREVGAAALRELVQRPCGVRLGPTSSLCPALVELVAQLKRIAATSDPVLLLGETGVGKEIIAHTIHDWSQRRGDLRAIDCGAIPESLFESTFFGHRKGAFTDAQQARVGEMVLAHEGTLFLDEVANMGPNAQAKFLRALETGQVTPLGASAPQNVDVRVVAATNRDLLADNRGFRLDLLTRLAGFVVRIPPLRARREDLGLLSRHFLREVGVSRARIRPAAARRLFSANFPGNLRQLRACLRSAATLAGDAPIELEHLPSLVVSADSPSEGQGAEPARPHAAAPDANQVHAALAEAKGNVVQAARALNTHPKQLYRWMKRFAIDPTTFRRRSGRNLDENTPSPVG